MFVRFFDVDLSKSNEKPVPLGVIDSLGTFSANYSIIPVVFITNRTFFHLTQAEVEQLAKKVTTKINALYPSYQELQIDCDWSANSRENYFLFLEEVKKEISAKANLSCTVRLHQIKYPVRSGVPPVDRGMLMFYNMGDLTDMNGPNSIYDKENANKYVPYIKNYSLKLDVALPIFKWLVHYHNNEVAGLVTKKQMPDITDADCFVPVNNNSIFKLKHDTLIKGVYYNCNDILKYEMLDDEHLLEAADLLKTYLKEEERRVVLYDLDELNLENYESKTIKKVFSIFN